MEEKKWIVKVYTKSGFNPAIEITSIDAKVAIEKAKPFLLKLVNEVIMFCTAEHKLKEK